MIQRIQSVWLFLAAISVALTVKLPFYSGTSANGIPSYELNATENLILLGTTLVTGLLAIVIIFLYKKRPLQLRLCFLGILLEAIILFLYYREVSTFTQGTYALFALLHGLSVIFFFLAARAINKDEKMVKDSNRLR